MNEINYNEYHFRPKELVLLIAIGLITLSLVGICFYDNIFVGLFFSPLLYVLIQKRRRTLCERRKKELQKQFREAILSVSAGMRAGYSVENAFLGASRDVILLFGKESDMAKELNLIMKKLKMNQPIEHILYNLGERSNVEDIMDFALIFQIAKRNGGDLIQAIETTAGIIREKGEVMQEIEVMLSGKNLEKNIMMLIPFFMVGYLSITSKGYFTPLYHNFKGVAVASICLIIYIAACFLMNRMTKIEV